MNDITPWVALWTAERDIQHAYTVSVRDGRLYAPDAVQSRLGWWFFPTPTKREGKPLFGDVHSDRQANCMGYNFDGLGMQSRCQVCGEVLQRNQARWLLYEGEITMGVSVTPPVCPDCVKISQQLCPHLKANERGVYTAEDWGLAGVFGQLGKVYGSTIVVQADPYYCVANAAEASNVIARQLAITFDNLVRID